VRPVQVLRAGCFLDEAMTDRFFYESIIEPPDLPDYPSILRAGSDSPKPAKRYTDLI